MTVEPLFGPFVLPGIEMFVAFKMLFNAEVDSEKIICQIYKMLHLNCSKTE